MRVVAALARRSVLQTFRRPQLAAPLLIFPTLLLAIQSAGAGRAIDLPGFPPVDSFLDYLLAAAMIQSAMFAGNTAGIALAVDIEMGFTDRLLAAPIPRFAIVAGRLAATGVLGFLTAIWFLAIGLLFGVRIEEGIPGALLMIVLVTISALAFGSLGAALALRTGSASVV
ncbi:MAG: ABC transporter permease, partial [Solirubrobacterales bacterium]